MDNPPLVLLTAQSHCPLQPLTIQPTPPRDVSRDKSICRHHCSKGVLGHAPSENVDILYRRSCLLGHVKAYVLKETISYFAALAKLKNNPL